MASPSRKLGSTVAALAALGRRLPPSALRRPPADLILCLVPAPASILRDVPLAPRLMRVLQAAAEEERADPHEDPWTVGRLLSVSGFGLRALADVVRTAVELHERARTRADKPGVLEDELGPLLTARPRVGPHSAPLLERTIDLVASWAPVSEAMALRRLIRQGLVRGTIRLVHIERASRFASVDVPFGILRRGDLCVVVPQHQMGLAQRIDAVAVRAVVSFGVARLDRIRDQANTTDRALVEAVVTARRSFAWLDKRGGWFWFVGAGSRLIRNIEEALAASGSVPLAGLARSVFERRPRETVPSPRAFATLCAELPGVVVQGELVSLAETPEVTSVLHASLPPPTPGMFGRPWRK